MLVGWLAISALCLPKDSPLSFIVWELKEQLLFTEVSPSDQLNLANWITTGKQNLLFSSFATITQESRLQKSQSSSV